MHTNQARRKFRVVKPVPYTKNNWNALYLITCISLLKIQHIKILVEKDAPVTLLEKDAPVRRGWVSDRVLRL